MDPISQGIVGTVVVQNVLRRRITPAQWWVVSGMAFLAAMVPDLDVVIRSADDPLLFLEFHRQFTHSLVFIPLGGLLCTLVFHPLMGKRVGLSFGVSYVICTAAYGTHGLLDSCTSYGTQLLWPFSNARIAWHNLPIIDLFYTLPLMMLAVLAIRRRRSLYSGLALAWLCVYPMIGVMQRERAETLAYQLASERGHQPLRLEAKPSFANLLVWKVVYEIEQPIQPQFDQLLAQKSARYYVVDALRLGVTPKWYFGTQARALDVARDLPWLDKNSQQARDIERFRWFSNDHLSVADKAVDSGSARIGDMRYSMIPNQVKPLWGIQLDARTLPDQHVGYFADRANSRTDLQPFWTMLAGD